MASVQSAEWISLRRIASCLRIPRRRRGIGIHPLSRRGSTVSRATEGFTVPLCHGGRLLLCDCVGNGGSAGSLCRIIGPMLDCMTLSLYFVTAVIPYILSLHDNPLARKIRTYTALIHSGTTQITPDFSDPMHIGLSKWWLNPNLPLPF
jgi:hypothetical protein